MKTELTLFHWVARSFVYERPAYHVELTDIAETMEDVEALGGIASRIRVVSMEAATAEGFTLDAITSAINEDAILRVETLETELAKEREPKPAEDRPSLLNRLTLGLFR